MQAWLRGHTAGQKSAAVTGRTRSPHRAGRRAVARAASRRFCAWARRYIDRYETDFVRWRAAGFRRSDLARDHARSNNDDCLSRASGRALSVYSGGRSAGQHAAAGGILMRMLCRDHGNWVRVGDPNQAIMTTFTASDVAFFRKFIQRTGVRACRSRSAAAARR